VKWKKLGRIFCPEGNHSWMQSHAAVPFAVPLGGDLFRIYFSTRDVENRSRTASLDLDIRHPSRVLALSPDPLFDLGELGAFDDSGVMISWIVPQQPRDFVYYFGWNLGRTVSFRNSIGLAYKDGENLARAFRGPILDRTRLEPHFCANPCVLEERSRWRMWYLSCIKWEMQGARAKHYYHIKYAESADGIDWDRRQVVALDFEDPSEYAFSRPCVLRDADRYRMWYSYRGDRYRIGYAESTDGIAWTRMDAHAGIDTSPSGWDSEMVEYPFVFDHGDSRYMLYNGNDYGRTGFGLAVLE
jgi:hypothetical protein